jgi:heat shock protein HslJ
MRRIGVALVAILVVACGGDGAAPGAAAGPTASTRGGSAPALLPNTLWHIASIDGQPSTADPPTKIFFGLTNAFHGLQVSGLCASLFGTYGISGGTLTPALELDEATGCTADQTAYRKAILETVNGATGWSVAGDVLTLTGAKTVVLERG